MAYTNRKTYQKEKISMTRRGFVSDLRYAKEVYVVEQNIDLSVFATKNNHVLGVFRWNWVALGLSLVYISQAKVGFQGL